jgi:NitT/TauT family transport system permease protein
MRGANQAVYAIGLPIAAAILLTLLWQFVVTTGGVPQYFLPAPLDVGRTLMATLPSLLEHMVVSGTEAVAAFLCATVLGFVVAGLLCYSPLLKDIFYPVIVGFQMIPKVALAPLFIVWLGTDSVSRVAFATFLSFFPVLISTLTGLQNANPNVVRLSRSLTASDWQIFLAVRIPFSLPYFFSSIKVAATLAVTGIVVAEFITANAGLGFLILYSGPRMETLTIFAAIIMLCIVGLSLYGAVALFERAARRWFKGT